MAAETYEQALRELITEGVDLVVMTAENRSAIRNLPPLLGPRFIDVGIAEQTMIGAAAGLALRGRIPVCHALTTFLVMRAFEFIRTDVGIPGLPVKLVGAVPGFLSDGNGPTHQAVEDIALMRGVPGMQVFAPADQLELAQAMPAIVKSGRPAFVRYTPRPPAPHRGQPRSITPFTLGRAEVIGPGLAEEVDVSLLTYGFLLEQVLHADELLTAQGLRVRVLNMRTLAPVDEGALLGAARSSRLLVSVEDHFAKGGLASIAAETFLAARLLPRAFLPINLGERWFRPGLLDQVLDYEGFTGEKLAARVRAAL